MMAVRVVRHPRRRSPAVLPAPSGRRSRAQGRWSLAPAPVTGWTDRDRGPQADAGERTRSAHRAIEIREKRRRVLSSRPGLDYLAPQPTFSVKATELTSAGRYLETGEDFRALRTRASYY